MSWLSGINRLLVSAVPAALQPAACGSSGDTHLLPAAPGAALSPRAPMSSAQERMTVRGPAAFAQQQQHHHDTAQRAHHDQHLPLKQPEAEQHTARLEEQHPPEHHQQQQQQVKLNHMLDTTTWMQLVPGISTRKPSRSAADQLAAAVLRALPGVRLSSTWVVYPATVPRGSGGGANQQQQQDGQEQPSCICILPELQPAGYFCSTAAVVQFLQQLQEAGIRPPGVLDQPAVPTSPVSTQRQAAAVTAALLSLGASYKPVAPLAAASGPRDSSVSDSTDAAARRVSGGSVGGDAAAPEGPGGSSGGRAAKRPRELAAILEQQQRLLWGRDSGHTLPADAAAPAPTAGEAEGGAAAADGGRPAKRSRQGSPTRGSLDKLSTDAEPRRGAAEQSTQGTKQREPVARLAAAAAAQAGVDTRQAADQQKPKPASLHQLLQRLQTLAEGARSRPPTDQRRAQSPATQGARRGVADEEGDDDNSSFYDDDGDDSAWRGSAQQRQRQPAAAAAAAAAAAGGRSMPPINNKLNRVDAKLFSLRRAAFALGLDPAVSAEMAAPVPRRRPSNVERAIAAGGMAAYAYSERLPPRPRPTRNSGGAGNSSSGGFYGGSYFHTSNGPAAAGVPKSRSGPSGRSGKHKPKDAAGGGTPGRSLLFDAAHNPERRLPDGRTPSADGVDALQDSLATALQGARLDRDWLVYTPTAQGVLPRCELLIRHPELSQRQFRSYRAVVTFYRHLAELLKTHRQPSGAAYASKPLVVPGLALLPNCLPPRVRTGKSPEEMQGLVTMALTGNSGLASAAPRPPAAAAAPSAAAAAARSNSEDTSKPRTRAPASAGGPSGPSRRLWQPPPLVKNLEPPRKDSAVLVLGMFYASEATAAESHDGLAQYRDRVRLVALHRQLGYKPHSFDRDHDEDAAELGAVGGSRGQPLHVRGNFNSKRGAAAVADRFPNTRFSAVLLDYFRMPSGYAGETYKGQLFTDYIPELVRRGSLPAGVPIYLPNSRVLLDQLAAAGAFADYGDVVAVPAASNPLWAATQLAEVAGQMPKKYSNEGQTRELSRGAEFVVVHYCGDASIGAP